MIISHDYKFIFIKTNKTAGTSIEIALSKFCGPNDIITPISPQDEEIRKSLGYRGPQNHIGDNYSFYNHISAQKIQQYIDRKIWNSYYKFCFERNPWDRLISLYYYWSFWSKSELTISEFLKSDIPLRIRRKGSDLYMVDNKVAVDKICFYEKLTEELEAICTQLGIREKLVLPKAKSEFRKDKRSYREILSSADRLRVAELFSKEIALFGYEF